MKGQVLILEDEQESCALLEATLDRHGFKVTTSKSAEQALSLASQHDFDVMVTDLGAPTMNDLEECERVLAARSNLPVIVLSSHGSLETAMAAIRAGVYDFLTKPVEPALLIVSVSRAVRHRRLVAEVERLQRSASNGDARAAIGESSAMRSVYERIRRVGDSDVSILIHGETGTGKELIARAVHAESRRKAGPFVAINCAAVPTPLLESELFGHTRGAFTDAKLQRIGLFVQANGGTLFLDEIGELPIDVQPKLLRALQERKVRPIGSNREIPFDARIVTATNRDLQAEVTEGRFREDLYYRINVVKIAVPPLRDRAKDVLHLAQHFLKTFAARIRKPTLELSTSAAEKLVAYQWPGNVRELENCMEHAVALARFDRLSVEDLPEKIRAYHSERLLVAANDPTELVMMNELERRYVLRVLELVGGNKTRAAQMLGFDRRTLYRKLERYGVGPLPSDAATGQATGAATISSATMSEGSPTAQPRPGPA